MCDTIQYSVLFCLHTTHPVFIHAYVTSPMQEQRYLHRKNIVVTIGIHFNFTKNCNFSHTKLHANQKYYLFITSHLSTTCKEDWFYRGNERCMLNYVPGQFHYKCV